MRPTEPTEKKAKSREGRVNCVSNCDNVTQHSTSGTNRVVQLGPMDQSCRRRGEKAVEVRGEGGGGEGGRLWPRRWLMGVLLSCCSDNVPQPRLFKKEVFISAYSSRG